ncbi:hypothetical protein PR048_020190 [Dryococelus australis]|uniref:Uncharacterized protein n=1 Tax=Dryococelus australis TaxID=614101 RepID=A0ABQ9H5Q3_9NEOP|nr:hypothetical protein PR048_020190 [Dryococelus australis]
MMGLCENKRFNDIKVTFPLRGHSFMPNERIFGIIMRKLRKEERYCTVNEVAELIKLPSKNPNKWIISSTTVPGSLSSTNGPASAMIRMVKLFLDT